MSDGNAFLVGLTSNSRNIVSEGIGRLGSGQASWAEEYMWRLEKCGLKQYESTAILRLALAQIKG